MQQETTRYQRMVSGARRLQAVVRRGGGVGVLAVLLLLPLTAAGQDTLETLAPPESDVEVAAQGLVGPGDLDTSFGGDGMVTTDFGGGEVATAVAIQPDGKIVVAGRTTGHEDFALARYLPDGSLDPTFNGDGKITIDLQNNSLDDATAVAVQPDGKIVVAGDSSFAGSGSGVDFALVRYLPNLRSDLRRRWHSDYPD
jgi:uncharacterized delta-60 repeat protein